MLPINIKHHPCLENGAFKLPMGIFCLNKLSNFWSCLGNKNVVLRTIIKYSNFKVLWPLYSTTLFFLQFHESNFDKCNVRIYTHCLNENMLFIFNIDIRPL
jgi:hypothetical protein